MQQPLLKYNTQQHKTIPQNIIGTLLINKYCLMDINWAHTHIHSLSRCCWFGLVWLLLHGEGTAVKSSTSRNLFQQQQSTTSTEVFFSNLITLV